MPTHYIKVKNPNEIKPEHEKLIEEWIRELKLETKFEKVGMEYIKVYSENSKNECLNILDKLDEKVKFLFHIVEIDYNEE